MVVEAAELERVERDDKIGRAGPDGSDHLGRVLGNGTRCWRQGEAGERQER
jgi:hypothetical protein